MSMKEFSDSLKAALFERTTSPFYGSFFISWSIWNWKILYLTFFISESKIKVSKIDYIVANYLDWCDNFWIPLVSAISIILIGSCLSYGAYFIQQKFRNWKLILKYRIEGTSVIPRKTLIAAQSEFNAKIESLEQHIAILTTEKNNSYNSQESLSKKYDESIKLQVELKEKLQTISNANAAANGKVMKLEQELQEQKTIEISKMLKAILSKPNPKSSEIVSHLKKSRSTGRDLLLMDRTLFTLLQELELIEEKDQRFQLTPLGIKVLEKV